MIRRILLVALAVGAALLLAIQLVPYGHQHTNPPVIAEPAWSDPVIREGEMPPAYYRLMHRPASLTAAETTKLAQGLAGLR